MGGSEITEFELNAASRMLYESGEACSNTSGDLVIWRVIQAHLVSAVIQAKVSSIDD